jgi:hypothetical protein
MAQPGLTQSSKTTEQDMFIMPLYGSSRRKVPLRQKLCQGAAFLSSLTIENTGIVWSLTTGTVQEAVAT